MALTTLDAKTALVLIDLQKGIVALPTAHPSAEIVKRSAALADAFRGPRLPVVIVTVAGAPAGRTEQPPRGPRAEGWDELVPEIVVHPGDHRVVKRTWGAFTNTDLAAHLKALGVTQVVIAGIATSAGVESTARHARE